MAQESSVGRARGLGPGGRRRQAQAMELPKRLFCCSLLGLLLLSTGSVRCQGPQGLQNQDQPERGQGAGDQDNQGHQDSRNGDQRQGPGAPQLPGFFDQVLPGIISAFQPASRGDLAHAASTVPRWTPAAQPAQTPQPQSQQTPSASPQGPGPEQQQAPTPPPQTPKPQQPPTPTVTTAPAQPTQTTSAAQAVRGQQSSTVGVLDTASPIEPSATQAVRDQQGATVGTLSVTAPTPAATPPATPAPKAPTTPPPSATPQPSPPSPAKPQPTATPTATPSPPARTGPPRPPRLPTPDALPLPSNLAPLLGAAPPPMVTVVPAPPPPVPPTAPAPAPKPARVQDASLTALTLNLFLAGHGGLWPMDGDKRQALKDALGEVTSVKAGNILITNVYRANTSATLRRSLLQEDSAGGTAVTAQLEVGDAAQVDGVQEEARTAIRSGSLLAACSRRGLPAQAITLQSSYASFPITAATPALSSGAIVGISVGIALFLGILVSTVCFVMHRYLCVDRPARRLKRDQDRRRLEGLSETDSEKAEKAQDNVVQPFYGLRDFPQFVPAVGPRTPSATHLGKGTPLGAILE